jgi:hypothetical protein
MKYENLTDNQKIEYKIFCDKYFGKSNTFSSGEPLYFTENGNMYKFKDIFQGIRRFKLEKINNINA